MWPMILLAGVALGIGISIGIAIKRHFLQPCYKQSEAASRQSMSTSKLGECCQCNEDVDTVNGYKMQCNHAIHYTCLMCLKIQLGNYYKPNMDCKKCIPECYKNPGAGSIKGLRNRIPEAPECANCEKVITKNPRILACKHKVHEACWTRMEQTSTTCPRCMEMII